MSQKLFGIDVAKIVADNIGPGVLPATLTKFTPGAVATADPLGGTAPTSVSYSCRGFIDSQAIKSQELIKRGLVRIVLIGNTISGGAVGPEPGDRVVIEGRTYVIGDDSPIDRDPAGATWTFEAQAV